MRYMSEIRVLLTQAALMLRCVAVCCSGLQCVATCRSGLQCDPRSDLEIGNVQNMGEMHE